MTLYRISFCSLVLSLATLPEAIAGLPANLLPACVQQVVVHVAEQQKQFGKQEQVVQKSQNLKYAERIVFKKKTTQPTIFPFSNVAAKQAINFTAICVGWEHPSEPAVDARQRIAAQNLRLMI